MYPANQPSLDVPVLPAAGIVNPFDLRPPLFRIDYLFHEVSHDESNPLIDNLFPCGAACKRAVCSIANACDKAAFTWTPLFANTV